MAPRREPRHTREQAQAYRDEAEVLRAELEAEKAATTGEITEVQRRLRKATVRAVMDDKRVVAAVQAARAQRDRNHFTDTVRTLLRGA